MIKLRMQFCIHILNHSKLTHSYIFAAHISRFQNVGSAEACPGTFRGRSCQFMSMSINVNAHAHA